MKVLHKLKNLHVIINYFKNSINDYKFLNNQNSYS